MMEEKTTTHEERLEEIRKKKVAWEEAERFSDQQERPFHRYPDYAFAGFWIRFFAYLVDLLVVQALVAILIKPIFALGSIRMQGNDPLTLYGFLQLLIFVGYFIVTTKYTNGQTLGKMIFGIRVVCFKEEKLTWQTILIREGVGRYIGKIVAVIYLVAAFQNKKQHPIDMLCDTSVVTENSIRALQEGY
ncbi:putative RDD family membrane protein YckC [Trichococcus patagoniensis]|uniref:Putative RDD family membrane protein YckC n=1 Tax=Trichococcus patagoniensis TaxID=382641 RepID=A0A2T5IN41_9LACT|nr:RDD family protein [Trichococcus patagoniensis]PTQ85245.1 putative RDD family membrane protein YckC [Trichococcus patagoniensis]